MKRVPHRREVFAARLKLGPAVDLAELKLRRGRHVRETDCEGAIIADRHDPLARLWLELGDRALVAPVDLADQRIGIVEVIALDEAGDPSVQLITGELAIGDCHVMRALRPSAQDRLRAVVRRARLAIEGAP